MKRLLLALLLIALPAFGQVPIYTNSPGIGGGGTVTGPITFPDGSASAPSILFTGDTQTGWYQPATDQWSFTVLGTPTQFFTNVLARYGIGVTLAWANGSNAVSGSSDTGLSRSSAGVVAVGTGAQGSTAGTLVANAVNAALFTATTGTLTPQIQATFSKTLTESAATGFVTIGVASSEVCTVRVEYTVVARDATNTQAKSGHVFQSAVANSSGTVTAATLSDADTLNPVSSGTLTNTMTSTTAANAFTLLANAASSLTQTLLEIRYRVYVMSGTCTVTPL